MKRVVPFHSFSGLLRLLSAAMLLAASTGSAAGVAVSRVWANHQPIFWPDWGGGHVQFAADSIERKGSQNGHPEDDLVGIFTNRVQAYQHGPSNSLARCDAGAGYAVCYSGSLVDNVRSLGDATTGPASGLGYDPGCFDGFREAVGWKDGKGNTRMDMVGTCYHHALAPVLPKAVFRKEVQLLKQSAWKAWGGSEADRSKGFFPPEMAFSEEMIDVLAAEGYQWVVVASHHFSRTCPTYLAHAGASAGDNYGIGSSEPNRADLNGPSPTDGWWYDATDATNGVWNVAPFAYRLHKVQYVDPWTKQVKQMVAVPSDDAFSRRAGRSGAETNDVARIAYGATADAPVIVLAATEGDNGWGGSAASWMDSWPGFTRQAAQCGWDNTTIQSFVDDHGPGATLAHVEDGAWIFPEMCYGSPYFLKWVDPPCNAKNLDACYPGTQVDLETPGFALKFWDWAPIIAAANWCETAERILGRADPWRIAAPHESGADPNAAEWAWHVYLAGLDSRFYESGGLGNDDECKPPLANLRAIETLRGSGLDQSTLSSREGSNGEGTPPSMLRPQRFPYNPGGFTFGPFNATAQNGSFRKKMGSDFYVWTHVYDVSGIPDGGVKLFVRADNDGFNPVDSIQNETFEGGDEVGEWFEIPMTKRVLPSTCEELNALSDNGQINYVFEPAAVADYYFAKVTQFRDQLVDYFVEATDEKGNTVRSDIRHVWVEDGRISLPYVDAEGVERISPECSVLTGDETILADDWYAAVSTVSFATSLSNDPDAANDVRLVLADGAAVRVGTNAAPVSGAGIRLAPGGTLSVFGQRLGTGSLEVFATERAIDAAEGVELNGGRVAAFATDGADGVGVEAPSIVVRGGRIRADGAAAGLRVPGGDVRLGWRRATDSVLASSFAGAALLERPFGNGETNLPAGAAAAADVDGRLLTPPEPSYVLGADPTIRGNYGAWAARNGFDEAKDGVEGHERAEAFETHFLLDAAPAAPADSVKLRIASFAPVEDGWRVGFAGDAAPLGAKDGTTQVGNGYLSVLLSDDLSEPVANWTAARLPVAVDPATGALSVDVTNVPALPFLRLRLDEGR